MQEELAKQLLREMRDEGVRVSDVARYITQKTGKKCETARAARILDNLSGNGAENANKQLDFLVWEDDFAKPVRYYIAKDVEMTGNVENAKSVKIVGRIEKPDGDALKRMMN